MSIFAEAGRLRAAGDFKQAHIAYGRAMAEDSDSELARQCRHGRGICSVWVAEERLRSAAEDANRRIEFLDQAALWLCKAEANLDSALEDAPRREEVEIRLFQAAAEGASGRWMEMKEADGSRRRRLAEERFELALRLLGQPA